MTSSVVRCAAVMTCALVSVLPVLAAFEKAPEPENVPPLLTTVSGKAVDSVAAWEKVRRREIAQTFATEVYGVRPVEKPADLRFETLRTEEAYGGKAVRKLVRGTYSGPFGSGELVFSAWIPSGRAKSAAFVHLSPRPAETADDPKGPRPVYTLPAEYLVSRCYAAIAVCDYDSAPDWDRAPKTATNGVFKAFGPSSADDRQHDEWGILSAWAWGASRVMDWIETEPKIDAARVGVVGLSRNGKAALVAGATDTRFAMTVSCCSGMGGAKLNHMESIGSETVRDISIAHRWFAPKFKQWVGRDTQMPFDAHWFLALVAPRLLYVSSASEDAWAGPRGEFASCVLATPAWNLYGKAGLIHHGFPRVDQPLHAGNIGYHLRDGVHDLTLSDWCNYLDFADGHGWNLPREN